jgi:superoxide dismutase, Cu-Zn family
MRVAAAFLATSLIALPAAAKTNSYVAHVKTSDGKDAGTVTFSSAKNKVIIKAKLKNLPAGDHAIHVHEHAVCDAPDFKTAGGHFNPDAKKHGTENPAGHHNGDMPHNLTVAGDGTTSATFTVDYLSLDPAASNSLFANGGTSVVIHEKPDDMKTDPTGNAGNRIACGVITAPK